MRPRIILAGMALLVAGAAALFWGTLSPWLHTGLRMLMPHDHTFPSYPPPPPVDQWRAMAAEDRLANARRRLLPGLQAELAAKQLELGQAAFIRIFKESSELELWLRSENRRWELFRTYPIACFSGLLGPKIKEGDFQSPEGFYNVTQTQLNPASSYHLSFNIGYPNAYDQHHQRTGSLIMVHGDVCSVGCFAMTDRVIEEIYLVVDAALHSGGDTVPVHVFPFRMTEARMQQAQVEASPHLSFWQELLPAYTAFEANRQVPAIRIEDGRYTLLP